MVTSDNIKESAWFFFFHSSQKNKTNYIRKAVMVKECVNGGTKALDFESMLQPLKWNSFKLQVTPWLNVVNIPYSFLLKCGRYRFFKMWFWCLKIIIHISKFHKHILQYWKMVLTHSISAHDFIPWTPSVYVESTRNPYWTVNIEINVFCLWMTYWMMITFKTS